jgi:type I restriction enzyme S subunit
VDIDNGSINKTGLICTTKQISDSYRRTVLRAGDLVMPLRGKVGDVGEIDEELAGANLTRGVALLAIRSELSGSYCRHALSWSATRKRLEQSMNGSALQEIPIATLRSFQIGLPATKSEQQAIAAALSDVDALLGGLDRLIAKKRDIKQAAMQQLLTGQTRLPGFSGEWEVKRLGEIGDISGAGVDKKIHPNEIPVRLLNYMDVYKKNFLRSVDFEQEVSARPDQARRCAVQRGDVFFTPTSEVRDDIGHSAVAMEDMPDVVYSYHVVRLRIFGNWDVQFRAYVFKTKNFMDQASTQCEGSGTRYVITLPKFRSMTVLFPTDVKEQIAIATVLSDMDAELAALEARRDKTRALKQAMMQELLTGKTRLV